MDPIIEFIVDGKLFAQRNWRLIPRVGEIVLLRNGEVWVEVIQVYWGDDSAAPAATERQWVQLACKLIAAPTANREKPAGAGQGEA